MDKTIEVELPSGKKLFLEPSEEAGLREVSAGGKAPKIDAGQFEGALGTLGELIGLLEKSIDALPNRPAKVEVEFSASLSGNCNLIIAKGEGKAEFKVKLAWEGERSKSPPISGEILHNFVAPKEKGTVG